MQHFTIISGGQTGVDTAAIEAAIMLRMPYRGWVPRGLTNETGVISEEYRLSLRETPSSNNAQRTKWNMRDGDMILTILRGPRETAVRGTKLGVDVAIGAAKPMCFVDLIESWEEEITKLRIWVEVAGDKGFSIAVGGPRESEKPGILEEATRFLIAALGSCEFPISTEP